MIVDFEDEDIEKHPFDKTLEGMPTNFQNLMDHPTLTDKAFSKFRDYVKLNKNAIFDTIFLDPNWK